jgi:hypothetical protein
MCGSNVFHCTVSLLHQEFVYRFQVMFNYVAGKLAGKDMRIEFWFGNLKEPLERPRRRWEDNIEIYVEYMRGRGLD